MAAKFVLFCASALVAQVAYGQIIPCGAGNVLANNINLGNGGIVLGNGLNTIGLANPGYNIGLANGVIGGIGNVGVIGGGVNGVSFLNIPDLYNIGSSGPLVVSTISPIGPSGLAVASENEIAGTLLVSGTLPFLSAVAFEGALPTAGSGIATCGCGNGAVGIISEGFPGSYPGAINGPYPGAINGLYPGAINGPYPGVIPGRAPIGIGAGFGGIYY